jgi:high-affinity iron transporter
VNDHRLAALAATRSLLAALLLCFASTVPAAEPAATLAQLLDYVGVDYVEAVRDGQVVNAGEYEEMQEFSAAITATVAQLPPGEAAAQLAAQARELEQMIAAHASPDDVRRLAGAMRATVLGAYALRTVPEQAPDLQAGAALYAQHCVACHGASGAGDGPAAAGLEPAPTDFTDVERARQRSLFGLYSTIGAGVEGTAMAGFGHLTEAERWALALHVGRLAFAPQAVDGALPAWASASALITRAPAELEAQHGADAARVVAAYRHDPAIAAAAPDDEGALDVARNNLRESLAAYQAGDAARAYPLALSAYLEGFELVEASLDAVDAGLRAKVERAMMDYRNAVQRRAPAAEAAALGATALELLEQAQSRLQESSIGGTAAFVASFVILLREGLEAILVVAALLAFLLKTGRREGLPYLHAGWIAALVLGAALGYASERFIVISGAQRELAEGIAALTAAAVMFGVGVWLHTRSQAAEWQRYIATHMNRILSRGSLWGLAALSFIAVFRECFETILFYQALWVQTDAAGRSVTFAGMGAAAVLLVAIGYVFLRYSTRLPIRPFFAVTGLLLLALAIVFAGKGVLALDEAGLVPVGAFDGPTISWLGIYPNALGLGLQAVMLLAGAWVLWRPRRAAGSPPGAP